MAQALSISPSNPLQAFNTSSSRIPSLSPRQSRSSLSSSTSPPPTNRLSPRTPKRRSESTESKENLQPDRRPIPIPTPSHLEQPLKPQGMSESRDSTYLNGGERGLRNTSLDPDDRDPEQTVRARKNPNRSIPVGLGKSSSYNGLPTLSPIPADPDVVVDAKKVPPPSISAGSGPSGTVRPVTRPRRSSSIKRKPSPGVTPTKAVDWEIPRKTLHSSIGILTLILYHLDPPTIKPLLTVLITALVIISTADALRLNIPAFAELWETYFGFLMRESERDKMNGVIWYLIGVIFVLGLYPRDVAVVSILTLSWSDTTASTIGRLWGKYTAPLPSHFPGVRLLPFAPRKSLAGFLAATVTGMMICLGFWWNGSGGRWAILEGSKGGLFLTAGVVGVGGAVVEALDLGLDDNLTLPILSGAIIWAWLGVMNLIAR